MTPHVFLSTTDRPTLGLLRGIEPSSSFGPASCCPSIGGELSLHAHGRADPDAAVGIDDEVLVVVIRVSRGEFQRCCSSRADLLEDHERSAPSTKGTLPSPGLEIVTCSVERASRLAPPLSSLTTWFAALRLASIWIFRAMVTLVLSATRRQAPDCGWKCGVWRDHQAGRPWSSSQRGYPACCGRYRRRSRPASSSVPLNRLVRPLLCSCTASSLGPRVTFARMCASDRTHRHAAAKSCTDFPL